MIFEKASQSIGVRRYLAPRSVLHGFISEKASYLCLLATYYWAAASSEALGKDWFRKVVLSPLCGSFLGWRDLGFVSRAPCSHDLIRLLHALSLRRRTDMSTSLVLYNLVFLRCFLSTFTDKTSLALNYAYFLFPWLAGKAQEGGGITMVWT